LEEDISRIMQI